MRYRVRAAVPDGFEGAAARAKEGFNALLQRELAGVAVGNERIATHFANRELWREARYDDAP